MRSLNRYQNLPAAEYLQPSRLEIEAETSSPRIPLPNAELHRRKQKKNAESSHRRGFIVSPARIRSFAHLNSRESGANGRRKVASEVVCCT